MKITDYFPSVSFRDKEEKSVVAANQSQGMSGTTGTLTMQTPKKRKERFSDPELHVLVDTILQHIQELHGSKPANKARKGAIWDEVVKRVNKQGQTTRMLKECRKRWDDYRVKIKRTIKTAKLESSLLGNVSWKENLSKRQIEVAEFFKWDTEDPDSAQLRNDSFLDNDGNLDSEDDFEQDEKVSPSECMIVDNVSNLCVPHSSVDHQNTKTYTDNIPSSSYGSEQPVGHQQAKPLKEIIEPTSTELPQQQPPTWDKKINQLISQQKQTNKMLKAVQENVSESLKLQKRMNRVLKTNFLELQKSVMSNQKSSSEQRRALENTMKSLHEKMDEINNQLRVKQLEELAYSDDSDSDTVTPKMAKATPGKKRKVTENPSSSGSLKKKGKKKD
ncbi:uncharacterized protein ACMZJ9_016136 [Mantella aurantiaca]